MAKRLSSIQSLLMTLLVISSVALPATAAPAPVQIAQWQNLFKPKDAPRRYNDNGITSDYHKQNIGKIVFSNVSLGPTELNPAKFKNRFTGGEQIYARWFTEKSIGNIYNIESQRDADRGIYVTIDGKKIVSSANINAKPLENAFFSEQMESEAYRMWTTGRFFIVPKSDEKHSDMTRLLSQRFAEEFGKLPPGEHKVAIALRYRGENGVISEPYASGEFSLVLGKGDASRMANASDYKLPPDAHWDGTDRAGVVADSIACLQRNFGQKPLKMGLISSDWDQWRDQDTLVWWRGVRVWAAFPMKDEPGNAYVDTYILTSFKDGDGNWTHLKLGEASASGPHFRIPISKVK